jgi:hypothetical protein
MRRNHGNLGIVCLGLFPWSMCWSGNFGCFIGNFSQRQRGELDDAQPPEYEILIIIGPNRHLDLGITARPTRIIMQGKRPVHRRAALFIRSFAAAATLSPLALAAAMKLLQEQGAAQNFSRIRLPIAGQKSPVDLQS